MKLSDAFLETTRESSIEIVVNLVNLNYNVDTELLKRSPTLLGYSKLLCYIQEQLASNGGDLKLAIDAAVTQCIEEGFIADFLRTHSREVTGMLFEEISMEEFAEIRAREAYDIGRTEGEQSGIERGAAQEKREIASNLKALNLNVEQIAKATGLSVAEIQNL